MRLIVNTIHISYSSVIFKVTRHVSLQIEISRSTVLKSKYKLTKCSIKMLQQCKTLLTVYIGPSRAVATSGH